MAKKKTSKSPPKKTGSYINQYGEIVRGSAPKKTRKKSK